MAEAKKADVPEGAFGKDKLYGLRIDEAFPKNEEFLLLGANVTGETIETTFGDAPIAKALVQRLDDKGVPTGSPFEVTTVASSIVDKLSTVTAAELAEGPICTIGQVDTKRSGTGKALIIQLVRTLKGGDDLLARYGREQAEVSKLADEARPSSERIPY